MIKKIIKGDYKYIQNKRNRVILITILYFALALGIILTGYITTGTKRNLLTVVGILGCLPACKSAVNMIMFIMARGCSEDIYNKLEPIKGSLIYMYDMYFTSYNNNYAISNMVVLNDLVIGYTEDLKINLNDCSSHIKTMLKQSGHTGVTVTIVNDIYKYMDMIKNINNSDAIDNSKDDETRIALYEVSL